MPKSKKTEYQKLTQRCDDLASLIVKTRAGFKCERCGHRKEDGYQMHWAHIIRRGAKEVRWDLLNAFCLCGGCHRHFDDSNFRHEAIDFILKKRGEQWWKDIQERSRQTKQWLVYDLRLMHSALEEIYKNL